MGCPHSKDKNRDDFTSTTAGASDINPHEQGQRITHGISNTDSAIDQHKVEGDIEPDDNKDKATYKTGEQTTGKNKKNKNVKQPNTNEDNSDRKSGDQKAEKKKRKENKNTEQPSTSEAQLKQKSIQKKGKIKKNSKQTGTDEVHVVSRSGSNYDPSQQVNGTIDIQSGQKEQTDRTELKQGQNKEIKDKVNQNRQTGEKMSMKEQIPSEHPGTSKVQLDSKSNDTLEKCKETTTEVKSTQTSENKDQVINEREIPAPAERKKKQEEMKKRLEVADQDKKAYEKALQDMKHELKEKEKRIEELQKTKDESEGKNKRLEAKVKTLKVEKDKLQQEMKIKEKEANEEVQGISDTMKQKDAALTRKRKEIELLKAEKDTLLLRISEMAGRRLTDNNPNIADLSDLNRPTKLAEKYSELYDNEWTDAISYLENIDTYKDNEAERINALLSILTIAYGVSMKTAAKQLNDMQTLLTSVHWNLTKEESLVKDTLKQFKDQRKRSTMPSADLIKEYRTRIKKAFPNIQPSSVDSNGLECYLQKCIELCWLMVIQDPPVYLECDVCKKGDQFNKNMFKEYTQSGQFVMFTVWPAVFLEKGGALLCKGVVQCEKEITSEDRTIVLDVENRSLPERSPEKQNRSSASTVNGDSSNISNMDENSNTAASTVFLEKENINKSTNQTYL